MEAKQLTDGIGDTFVSVVDVPRQPPPMRNWPSARFTPSSLP